jgi:hypothetical protein
MIFPKQGFCREAAMSARVNRYFAGWTEGLDVRQSMISIFYHIRDIPYQLSGSHPIHDPAQAGEHLLAAGRGSCAPKHYLLAEMYRRLNLSVVFATFPFLWNDPKIRYPDDLRTLATGMPVMYHLACRVQVGCRWVLVDATWDPPLQRAGFSINEHWDGYSDTKCAVTPLRASVRTAFCRTLTDEPCRKEGEPETGPADGEENHWEAEDRERYYRERVDRRTPEDLRRGEQFGRRFDEWLDEVRTSSKAKRRA